MVVVSLTRIVCTRAYRGYRVTLGLSVVGFFIITHWLLSLEEAPGAAFKFFLCGITGMACAYIIVLSTQVCAQAPPALSMPLWLTMNIPPPCKSITRTMLTVPCKVLLKLQ